MKHFVIPLTPSERERGKVGESESERVRETEMERWRDGERVSVSESQYLSLILSCISYQ